MKPPKDIPETTESDDYEHSDQAVQRPAVGVQEDFPDRRPSKEYRYDSSVAPELRWDEHAERAFAEWLLDLIERGAQECEATMLAQAAAGAGNGERSQSISEGEAAVFAQPPTWAGTGERFQSIAECVARLKSLTQPFLTWSGKAERQHIRVPTIPLFVHERQSTQAILSTLTDRPEENGKITRVCGRFTVESTVQAARSVDDPTYTEGPTPDVRGIGDTWGARSCKPCLPGPQRKAALSEPRRVCFQR